MFMKKIAYRIREWYKALFLYPVSHIQVSASFDYEEYWKQKRGKSIGTLSSWQKERADFICTVLQSDAPNIKVLGDIGCGDGSILAYIKSKIKGDFALVGYDSSEFALARAREYGVIATLSDISKPEAYDLFTPTDYYLLLETLEHVPESETLLMAAISKSKKGVFFSFPNTGYIRHRLRLLLGSFPLQWRIRPNEHVRFWTYRDLVWWLAAIGIKNYTIHCYEGVPILNKIYPKLFAAGFVVYVDGTK